PRDRVDRTARPRRLPRSGRRRLRLQRPNGRALAEGRADLSIDGCVDRRPLGELPMRRPERRVPGAVVEAAGPRRRSAVKAGIEADVEDERVARAEHAAAGEEDGEVPADEVGLELPSQRLLEERSGGVRAVEIERVPPDRVAKDVAGVRTFP